LPGGRYRIDYPARAPFVPAHIKPLRITEYHFDAKVMRRSQQGNLLGGTAADFFGLKGYL